MHLQACFHVVETLSPPKCAKIVLKSRMRKPLVVCMEPTNILLNQRTRLSSQAFKKSHGSGGGGKAEGKDGKPGFIVAAGGMSKIKDLIVEPPVPALYDAVIMEPVPPEHQGGLWDFEEEPSYFDGDM